MPRNVFAGVCNRAAERVRRGLFADADDEARLDRVAAVHDGGTLPRLVVDLQKVLVAIPPRPYDHVRFAVVDGRGAPERFIGGDGDTIFSPHAPHAAAEAAVRVEREAVAAAGIVPADRAAHDDCGVLPVGRTAAHRAFLHAQHAGDGELVLSADGLVGVARDEHGTRAVERELGVSVHVRGGEGRQRVPLAPKRVDRAGVLEIPLLV